MELTKEHIKIVTYASLGFVVLVLCLFLFIPHINKFSMLHFQCNFMERQLCQAEKDIEEFNRLSIKKSLAHQQDISLALDELAKEGRALGVDFTSITPGKINKDGEYKILPIEMQFKAGYKDVGIFLGHLAQLKNSVITVKSFKFTQDNTRPSDVSARVVLNMYIAE